MPSTPSKDFPSLKEEHKSRMREITKLNSKFAELDQSLGDINDQINQLRETREAHNREFMERCAEQQQKFDEMFARSDDLYQKQQAMLKECLTKLSR